MRAYIPPLGGCTIYRQCVGWAVYYNVGRLAMPLQQYSEHVPHASLFIPFTINLLTKSGIACNGGTATILRHVFAYEKQILAISATIARSYPASNSL